MTFLLQERKVVPDPSQWRQEQTRMTWTLSGFPNPISVLQGQARPVRGRGNPSVTLVLTPSNHTTLAPESELMINKDSDLQQIQTDYHYLTVNGHEICIMDFIVSVEIFAIQAGLGLTHSLLLLLCSLQSRLVVRLTAELFQHSD